MKTENNYLESQNTLLRHSPKKWNPDSISASLDSPSPVLSFRNIQNLKLVRGNDREKHLTKNLPPRLFGGQATTPPLRRTSYRPASSAGRLQSKKGFVMLFSVLIASLLVAVGLSIFNITLKELTISTAARESQTAFYAAHAGLECALYWDLHENAFSELSQITCGDTTISYTNIQNSSGSVNFSFNITTDADSPCAYVTVEKTTSGSTETTIIQSQGTNICVIGAGRRVQRGLKATYTR